MKIGMLGLGFMGSTHLKALQKIPQAEVVVVASDDEIALSGDLSGIQGNIGGPGEKMDFSAVRKYKDFRDAARDPGIEMVDICLPTNFHAEAAILALREGKHVLLEKPMALDGESCDRIIEEAEKCGRMLMVAQVLRFMPPYRALEGAMEFLGTVRSALFRRRCAAPGWSRWMGDPALSGGGVFDLLIHDVDFCQHLFGVPEAVSATGYVDAPQGIDFILAQFHYPNIGPVIVTGGWHHRKAYPFSMEYTVQGDGGTVEFNSAVRPPTLYSQDGKEAAIVASQEDGYQAELEYFLDCVRKGSKPEKCPPSESAAAVKLTRLMLESRARNGEKLKCRI